MATITTKVDDLDGKTEGAETTRITIRTGLDEQAVDIDLGKPNLDKLMTTLKPYFDAGREVARKSSGDSETTRAREWLQAHGHKVGEKGRIPEDLMAIYRTNVGSLRVHICAPLGSRAQGRKTFHSHLSRVLKSPILALFINCCHNTRHFTRLGHCLWVVARSGESTGPLTKQEAW